MSAATDEFPEDGSAPGEPIEMSEEDIRRLTSQLGAAGLEFLFVGGRWLVVPDHGYMVDMGAVVAIEPSMEGFAELILTSGEMVRLPVDAREVLRAIFAVDDGLGAEVAE